MYIPAYCDFDFLQNLTMPQVPHDPDNIEVYTSRHQLVELVRDGLKCKTNASGAEIEKSQNPYVKYLIKNFRISPDEGRMLAMREDSKFFKSKGRDVELYVIGEQDRTRLQEWKNASGCQILTSNDVAASLFEHRIQNFAEGQRGGWNFACEMLTPHYALAIADPYVLKPESLPVLATLIEKVAPKGLRGRYFVSLLGSNNRRESKHDDSFLTEQVRQKVIEPLRKLIPNLEIEVHLISSKDFHDRYLITNNACIFSGYGISTLDASGRTHKDSTWLAFKLFSRIHANASQAYFLSIHQEKVRVMAKWIKASGHISGNPLFKLFF